MREELRFRKQILGRATAEELFKSLTLERGQSKMGGLCGDQTGHRPWLGNGEGHKR